MAMKKRVLVIILAAAALAALGGAYALWGPKWPRGTASDATAGGAARASEKPPTEVVLSPEKFKNARITSVSVARRQVQDERTVPGQIRYRSIRRVELKAPVDAVVEKVRVKPGDEVKQGTRLADLTSPDVGLARAEVEKSESELRLANQAMEWAEEITHNLNDLVLFLQDKPEREKVEREFDDKLLGTHRETILSAYSKFIFAHQAWERAEAALKKGAMTEQAVRQRESNRDVAKAEFKSACEQSRFDARQAREKARQNRNYARRGVDVAKQKLQTLLGAFTVVDDSAEDEASPTHFYLIAPFEGTVEQRLTSDRQRVTQGSPLFVVANTDVLEAAADIREGDWAAVSPFFSSDHSSRRVVKVVVPALGEERDFEAVVDYMARMVDPETRAVPLVALIENPRHELFPGMFAWIRIPAGRPEEALVIPPAALRTHDRQSFVFVEDETEPRKFRRVDVKVGRETPEGVTITGGLKEGQRVVVEGVFLLKSELLLEPEEE